MFYPHATQMRDFFIKKNRFLEHVKFIFYINWWVGRRCLGLLSSVMRTLYHMFLRYIFYKSKILVHLQTYDNLSLSERWSFEEKILVVCSYEAQTLRNSCIASRLPSHQFLERADEVLWWHEHFTKIPVLSTYTTDEFF